MSQKPIRKDFVLIAAVLVVALLLAALSRLMPRAQLEDRVAEVTLAPDAVEYLDETPAPEQTPAPEAPEETEQADAPQQEDASAQAAQSELQAAGPMPAPQTAEVRGHVVLTVNGRQYGEPIPMDRDKIITIQQDDGKINKVHITPEEAYMESSTCDNQDCVGQGHITLENYETRILGTWVICLPNGVTIEMMPAE